MKNFAEFWPYYLQAHSRPATRTLHYFGTSLAVLLLVASVATGYYWLALVLPVVGYGFAWVSHGAVQGNRPATFGHPFWSLRGDFLMLWRWATGRLDPDLRAAGIAPDGSIDPEKRLN